jgi:hypothetical protein
MAMIDLHHKPQLGHSGILCSIVLLVCGFLNLDKISHKVNFGRSRIDPKGTLSISNLEIQKRSCLSRLETPKISSDPHLNTYFPALNTIICQVILSDPHVYLLRGLSGIGKVRTAVHYIFSSMIIYNIILYFFFIIWEIFYSGQQRHGYSSLRILRSFY